MNKYLSEAAIGLFFAICLIASVSDFSLVTPFIYQGF